MGLRNFIDYILMHTFYTQFSKLYYLIVMHFDEPEGEKKIQRFSPCDGERIRLANVSHAEN